VVEPACGIHSLSPSINRELPALRRMFYLGHQSTPKKVLDVSHFPMLRENNTRTGFLEDSHTTSLLKEPSCGFVRSSSAEQLWVGDMKSLSVYA
jgi:hypothetical protein